MQEVFDYFVTQLNDNTSDLVYKGNFLFRFNDDSMTVYDDVEDKLVKEEVSFSPVALLTKTPVVFVENNKRIDWLVEIGMLVRIAGDEYDETNDLDYANIESVLTDLQGAVVTIDSKRYSFKTQSPTYQGYTMLGRSKYVLLTCTMNITQVTYGYFGQDSVWSIDDVALDVMNVDISSTRKYYTSDKKDTLTNDYNKVIGRALLFEMTFNYNDETTLLAEARGKSTLTDTHTLTEVFGSTTYTWDVSIENASESMIKGGVKQIKLRIVEV